METVELELKQLILSRYKSILDFSKSIGMPYSTIDSIFKRGVANASITNIIKICNALGISADQLGNGQIVYAEKTASVEQLTNTIIAITSDGTKREYTLEKEQMRAILTFLDSMKK